MALFVIETQHHYVFSSRSHVSWFLLRSVISYLKKSP